MNLIPAVPLAHARSYERERVDVRVNCGISIKGIPTPCGLLLPLCRSSVHSVAQALVDLSMNYSG